MHWLSFATTMLTDKPSPNSADWNTDSRRMAGTAVLECSAGWVSAGLQIGGASSFPPVLVLGPPSCRGYRKEA